MRGIRYLLDRFRFPCGGDTEHLFFEEASMNNGTIQKADRDIP